MASTQKPLQRNSTNDVTEKEDGFDIQIPTIVTTNFVTENKGDLEGQISIIVVLSTILLVLLICLPFILYRLYRIKPGRYAERNCLKNSTISLERVISANLVNKAIKKVDNNVEETREKREISTVDVKTLEESGKHVYETLDECSHVYKNLVINDKFGTGTVDVFEAKCNDIMVDQCSTMNARLGNAKRAFASSYPSNNVLTQDPGTDSCVAMSSTLPTDHDWDNIHADQDYLDMSETPQKYQTAHPKQKNRTNFGSFYAKPKPRTMKLKNLPFDHAWDNIYVDPDDLDMSESPQKYHTVHPKRKKRKNIDSFYAKPKPHTMKLKNLPFDHASDNIYVDPDDLDMSESPQKYHTVNPKRKKRKHIASFYAKPKPRRMKLMK